MFSRTLGFSLAGLLLVVGLLSLVDAGAEAQAQKGNGLKKKSVQPVTIKTKTVSRAKKHNAFTSIHPSQTALAVMKKLASATAKFEITYSSNFPPEAKKAFQAAVDVWSAVLTSPVTTRIEATWAPASATNLGSTNPTTIWPNFANAPQKDTYYAVALANKLAKTDLAPGQSHIQTSLNSNRMDWYFGTDGKTPAGKYDLMSVTLHEIGHGLGFLGSMEVVAENGSWGFSPGPMPIIYDRFTENGAGQKLLNTTLFPNPSPALKQQLLSKNLVFNGPKTVSAGGGVKAKLYAPAVWEEGSSFSHLDEATYAPGTPNSLMTPFFDAAEAVHNPGPVVLSILNDMGW